jgi:hypothetical protein
LAGLGGAVRSLLQWHFLYFLPLPHQHESLRESDFESKSVRIAGSCY